MNRVYYVWAHNKTDCRDDEVWKVRALNKELARKWAQSRDTYRFNIGHIYTASEFRKENPGWYSLLSSQKPEKAD